MPPALIAKWSPDVLKEGFVPFPKTLLRCFGKIFTGKHAIDRLAVVLAIVDFKRDELSREPSIDYLAFTAEMPVEEFQTILIGLEKDGLVSVEATETGLNISLKGLIDKIEAQTKT